MLAAIDKLPLWSLLVASAVVGMLMGVLARGLVRRSLVHLADVRPTELNQVLAATLPRPVGVGVFLLTLAMALRFVPLPESRLVALHRFLTAGVAVLGVAVLMRVAARSLEAYGRSNPDLRLSAGVGKAAIWMIGLAVDAVLVSDALGISLAPALTALGVGSLALALGVQDTLSNLASGLYIVIDKPIRPGDFVRVDPSYEGYVETIGWRSTSMRTLSSNLVIIPNGTLAKSVITNYSRPTPLVAATVCIEFAADSDVGRIDDVLSDEAKGALDIRGIAENPAPTVSLTPGFVDGVIAFTIRFYARSFADQFSAQSTLRKRLAARLQKEGIRLADARPAPTRKEQPR
jgi:small-conductance mechanosensitive channel